MNARKTQKAPTAAWSRGGLLAVAMLEAFEESGEQDLTSLDDEYRTPGTPQLNLVARFMERLNGIEERNGFAAVLTHALSMYVNGNVPVLAWLELLATKAPSVASATWARRNAARNRELEKRQATQEAQS